MHDDLVINVMMVFNWKGGSARHASCWSTVSGLSDNIRLIDDMLGDSSFSPPGACKIVPSFHQSHWWHWDRQPIKTVGHSKTRCWLRVSTIATHQHPSRRSLSVSARVSVVSHHGVTKRRNIHTNKGGDGSCGAQVARYATRVERSVHSG
jgi:hypothetical protein